MATDSVTMDSLTARFLLKAAGVDVEDGAEPALDVAKSAGGVEGFSSEVCRCAVTLAGHPPLRFFVKFPFPGGGPKAAQFLQESMFYARFGGVDGNGGEGSDGSPSAAVPKTTLPLARCFLANKDVLVFEDAVTGKPDVKVGDQLVGCSRVEAEAVIKALATLHAQYFDHEVLKEPALQARAVKNVFSGSEQREGVKGAVGAGLAAHRGVLQPKDDATAPIVPNTVPPLAFEMLQAASEHLLDMADWVGTQEHYLRHADVRLDNMLFGPDGLNLIDWQAFTTGWYQADVCAFITDCLNDPSCLAADVEDDLLELYRTSFLAAVDPSKDTAWMTAARVKAEYELCVTWNALADVVCWLEQAANVDKGLDPFSGLEGRMAKLAPLIASNRCATMVRIGKDVPTLLAAVKP